MNPVIHSGSPLSTLPTVGDHSPAHLLDPVSAPSGSCEEPAVSDPAGTTDPAGATDPAHLVNDPPTNVDDPAIGTGMVAVDVGGGMTVHARALAVPLTEADGDIAMSTTRLAPPSGSFSDGPERPSAPVSESTNPVGPTLHSLLGRRSEIRRDRTPVSNALRLVMPQPSAVDIEAIEQLYASGGSWEALATSIANARPYQLPRARFVMTIDTGRAFERMGINKIVQSFLKDNGNPVVMSQINGCEIGQISKGRSGELRVKVKSKEACIALAGQYIKILGTKYQFSQFDILAEHFYLDISSVDSDFDDRGLMRGFFLLGAQPIYGTFRDVCVDSGTTTATWRVYFRSTDCPDALMVNEAMCDQVVFHGRMYPAQAKNCGFPSQRRGFGQRSPHALDLFPASSTPTPPSSPAAPESQRSFAEVVRQGTSTQVVSATPDESASVISVGTLGGSLVSPPPSPRSPGKLPLPPVTPPPALTLHPAGSTQGESGSKGKRRRTSEDFTSVLQKAKPKPITGIVTSNYFAVLNSVEVEFDCERATTTDESAVRFQIVPRRVKVSEAVKTSKESSHFLTKNHTNVEKTKEPVSIQEVVDEMKDVEETADLAMQPTHLAAADARLDGLLKTLRNTYNPDVLTQHAAVKSSLTFNSALLAEMKEGSDTVAELAHLHLINRVLSASDPSTSTTFAHKWAKYMGVKVPRSRAEVFQSVAHWWRGEAHNPTRYATRSLALFELMLMCTAPQVFAKDAWIQRITNHPVGWIPAQNCRLLHPNTLIALLRSEIGARCFEVWKAVQWQGTLFDDLEYIRNSDAFLDDESAVLQLQAVEEGGYQMMAGPLKVIC